MTKERKELDSEIKELKLKYTSLQADKTRNEENLYNYNDHKDFLDKLAPSVIIFI